MCPIKVRKVLYGDCKHYKPVVIDAQIFFTFLWQIDFRFKLEKKKKTQQRMKKDNKWIKKNNAV